MWQAVRDALGHSNGKVSDCAWLEAIEAVSYSFGAVVELIILNILQFKYYFTLRAVIHIDIYTFNIESFVESHIPKNRPYAWGKREPIYYIINNFQ